MSLNPYPNGSGLHDPFPPKREEAIQPPTYAQMTQLDHRIQVGQIAFFTGRLRGPLRRDDDRGPWRAQENPIGGGRERLDIPY